MTSDSRTFLIADSGSTKTDWRFISPDGKMFSFTTAGFNPFFWSSENIYREILHHLPLHIKSKILNPKSKIFFYGAGCSSPHRCSIIGKALRRCFPSAKVYINHDLLGAARALFGKDTGIAAILGTGSNSCLYDGNKIIDNVPSLGYVLGDEGSGAHIGKLFLKGFLYREIPPRLAKCFEKESGMNREKILHAVYNRSLPNRFLASFGKFLHRNLNNPYVRNIVQCSFEEFLMHHACKYKNYRNLSFGCVGSIGYHFRDILKDIANTKGIQIKKIIESPVDELVKYHLG